MSLIAALRDLAASMSAMEQNMMYQMETMTHEREYIRTTIADNQRLLNNALAERDRACRERDNALSTLQKEKIKRKSFDRLKEVERNFHKLTTDLQEKLRLQDEQLSGMRSLWMDNQPGSAVRARKHDSHDPHMTPPRRMDAEIQQDSSSDAVSKDLSQQFSGMAVASGSRSIDRSQFPTGSVGSSRIDDHLPVNPMNGFRSTTSNNATSMSLVPFQTEQQVADDFISGLKTAYNAVEVMATLRWAVPHSKEDDARVRDDGNVWPFMLSLTYPDLQDSHVHLKVVMQDVEERKFLVMRMALSYITRNIWSLSNWMDFNDDCRKRIGQAVERLATKGSDSSFPPTSTH